jgi:hypothetical protein
MGIFGERLLAISLSSTLHGFGSFVLRRTSTLGNCGTICRASRRKRQAKYAIASMIRKPPFVFRKARINQQGALYFASGTQAHWKKALLQNPIAFFPHELERITRVRRVPRLGPDYTCFANVRGSSANQINIYYGV